MKVFSIALAALMLMPILAFAVPDSVITGPYKISFDMGTPSNAYILNTTESIDASSLFAENSTMYNVIITEKMDTFRIIQITMTEYEKDQLASSIDLTKMVKDSSKLIIDGFNGAIVSRRLINHDMFTAVYYPSSRLFTAISSTYPWEEGTRQFLDTIHIEKMNATS